MVITTLTLCNTELLLVYQIVDFMKVSSFQVFFLSQEMQKMIGFLQRCDFNYALHILYV